MSECACSSYRWFLPLLTREWSKLGIFLLNCPNSTVNVRVSLFHNIILWQSDLLINKSNQFAVIVFYQSATGDIRENLDLAVERQKRVYINIYGQFCVYKEIRNFQ